MKIVGKWALFPILGLAFILAIAGTWYLVTSDKKQSEIYIAFAGPLTGDSAVFGVPQLNAATLAVENINAKGGLHGMSLELLEEDDKGNPRDAVSAARKIVSNQRVLAVIGHPNSGCALPASHIYMDANLPFITTTATNPILTDQGFGNVFRFAPTDDMQGTSIGEFMHSALRSQTAVFIHDNGAYGKGLEASAKARFVQLGGRVLLEDAIDPQARDFRQLLLKVSRLAPSVVFYGGMLTEGAQLVRQAAEVGLKTNFVFGDGCYDKTFIDLAGTDCRNVFISFLAAPVDQLQSARDFYKQYSKVYGDVPSFFTPYAFDAVNLAADAIARLNTPSKEGIIRILKEPGYAFTGVTGRIAFNSRGQTTNRRFYFYTFSANGQLSMVPWGELGHAN